MTMKNVLNENGVAYSLPSFRGNSNGMGLGPGMQPPIEPVQQAVSRAASQTVRLSGLARPLHTREQHGWAAAWLLPVHDCSMLCAHHSACSCPWSPCSRLSAELPPRRLASGLNPPDKCASEGCMHPATCYAWWVEASLWRGSSGLGVYKLPEDQRGCLIAACVRRAGSQGSAQMRPATTSRALRAGCRQD